jgi:hypothetical protein
MLGRRARARFDAELLESLLRSIRGAGAAREKKRAVRFAAPPGVVALAATSGRKQAPARAPEP